MDTAETMIHYASHLCEPDIPTVAWDWPSSVFRFVRMVAGAVLSLCFEATAETRVIVVTFVMLLMDQGGFRFV